MEWAMMHHQLHGAIYVGSLILILTGCRPIPTSGNTSMVAATQRAAPTAVVLTSAPTPIQTPRNAPPLERATTPPLPTPQTAEAGIVIAFIRAYNAGDLAAAVALLDDRAIASDCDYQRVRPIAFMGKTAVTDWLRQRMADHDQLTISAIDVGGGAIGVGYSRRTSDTLRKLGFPNGIQPSAGTKVLFTSDRKHIGAFANGPVGGEPEVCRPAPPLPTPQTAEAGIAIAFIRAYNAGDLSWALGLLDDDVQVSDCDYQRVRPIAFMGKTAVTDWLRQRMADHDQLTISAIDAGGGAIGVGYSRRTSDTLRKLGFPDGIQPSAGTKVLFTSDRKHIGAFANGPVDGDPEVCRPAN
jgi:hypothetical protein